MTCGSFVVGSQGRRAVLTQYQDQIPAAHLTTATRGLGEITCHSKAKRDLDRRAHPDRDNQSAPEDHQFQS